MPYLGFVLIFLEFALLILLGRGLGFPVLFAEILLSGFIGYSLMRFAGRTAFQPAQLIGVFLHATSKGFSSRKPIEQLLFGSLFLIIPGLLTDMLGLMLIGRYLLNGGSLRQSPSGSNFDSNSIDVDFEVKDDNDSQ